MRKKINSIVFQAIDLLNEQNSQDNLELIKKSESTKLYGAGSTLDSLGLVNLIVLIEQIIEDSLDITVTLADERAMSQKHSPFRTISSLIDYIDLLVKENVNAE